MEEEKNEATYERETYTIEGLDPIRARKGTDIALVAGAASYWQKLGKDAAARLDRAAKEAWWTGFGVGIATSLLIVSAALLVRSLW